MKVELNIPLDELWEVTELLETHLSCFKKELTSEEIRIRANTIALLKTQALTEQVNR